MLKKRHLVLPVAICSFLFIPLLSGVLSHNRVNAAYATADKVVVWEGNSDNIQLPTSDLPVENPDSFQIEFSGGFDNADIYDSEMNVTIKTILEEDNGETTFTDSEWASIKSDILIWIWAESKNITKISYTPKSVSPDHTHGEGADALSFYNWDGGTDHNSMPSVAGSYCLTSDIELTSAWCVPEGTTNLCLNGHNITMTVQDQNVISIGLDATLNLYDCGTQYQFFGEDANGLWSLLDEQDVPTDYAINGGCITGAHSSDQASGVYCEAGTFNMYGGNIVGNTGLNGPGVYCTSVFNMYGGTIVGNSTTIGNGGGVYVSSDAVCILTGGTITGNKALQGSGVCYKGPACFVEGTEITMADGSKQPIENLAVGDSVRVFDHNEGILSSSNIFDVGKYEQQSSDAMTLHFTDDIDLTVVYGHSFFEREENKYVSVTKDNVSNYVGEEFYNADSNCWETLIGYDLINEKVDTYIIVTEYDLNCVASGMLSVEDGFYTALLNTFDYGEDLKVDATKKAQDLEDYGVYGFENIKNVSKYTYDVLGLDRLNVTFGKHLFSQAKFSYLESACPEYDPEIYLVGEETKQVSKKLPLKSGVESPVSAPTEPGLYVGGSIKITGNNGGNLYIPTAESIVVGTGTVGEGNGVPAPTDEMLIGVTLQEGIGAFTQDGVDDYSENFFADATNHVVKFNDNGTSDDSSDDKLEIKEIFEITNNTPEDDVDTNNGYIEVQSSSVGGETISVSVVPNEGYGLSSLIYNDGTDDYDITSEQSFVMPEGAVSVTAQFKLEQEITISLQDVFIYPNTPSIQEAGLYVYSNYYEKLGDGAVTVEYKLKEEDDSKYTTDAPTEYGEYTVRVSVAEGTDYLAGVATKDFTYAPQTINQVGFGNLSQPVAGAVVPEKTGGMLVDTKYLETLTWDPAISTTNSEGKKIFDCDTEYTAIVTLTLKDTYVDNYKFAEDVVLKGAGTGWTLSEDSTDTVLIYTKEFDSTADHVVIKVDGDVSCTTDGFLDAYLCETCGLYYEDEACTTLIGNKTAYDAWKLADGKIDPLGHSMTHHDAVDATCEQAGSVEYWSCSECEKNFADEAGTNELNSVIVAKLDHAMTHHDAVAPSCTEAGTVEYWSCSQCGKNYADEEGAEVLESIVDPATGHSMTHHDAIEATCTENGSLEYWSCSECEKNFADSQGNVILESIIDPATGHSMTHHDAVPATCTQDGTVEYWSCSECGKNYADEQGTTVLESIVDPKLGHSMTHHEAVAPTCTQDGTVEYWTCSRDEDVYYANAQGTSTLSTTVDPATGHSMTHHDAVPPTCTQDGTVEYWSCSECDKNFADSQGNVILESIVDPKLGHDLQHHDAKAATCTEAGWEAYDTCSRCDYSTYVEIPALGHDIIHHEGKAATCAEAGYQAYDTCSRCDYSTYVEIPALGHDLQHHDAKAPTCTEVGWEAYDTCSRCDYSTYVEIPSLGHQGALVEGLDPTYEGDGYKVAYKCSTCGEYYEDEDCTKLIGDETAYNAWKANAGHLDKLAKEEPAKSNTGLIVGATCGGTFFLLLLVYTSCYFFLYRKGKLDARKIRAIYKFLPRGDKNLEK